GGYAKDVGNRLRHHQRVIADRLKRFRNAFKYPGAIVMNRARAAVHGFGRGDDLAAEDITHSLKAKTHSQHRNTGFEENPTADSEVAFILRTSGPGRENDSIGSQFEELVPGQLVVVD